jgi:predicted nucleotidyltransferase
MLLRDSDRAKLIQIFSSIDTPVEIWAFGSRVTGTAHDGSDLDLVIRTSDGSKLPLTTLGRLREDLSESNIPILVDLLDWARLPESFHRNIESSYEILYSNITR